MQDTRDDGITAAGLRARAHNARRLAKDVFDPLAKVGLLELAEECERQAAKLETGEAKPADEPAAQF